MKLLLPLILLSPLLAAAQVRPAIYNFDVNVDGQAAVYSPEFPLFARIPKPVTADAEVALGVREKQIIVNIFPCKEDGTVPERAPTKVILVTKGSGFKLDATMDKTVLGNGIYGMNIVIAELGTSRVMFTVGDSAADPAVTASSDRDAADVAAFDAIAGMDKKETPAAPGDGVDQSTPESTLSALFAAAKSGNLTPLLAITPESGDIDGDVQQIRDSATADPDLQAKFAKFFADGKIDGTARIEGDKAEVDFLFGPGGTRAETMNLVRRDGKWYLDSF